MVFFLIVGFEWVKRGSKSDSVLCAKEGVIICGSVMIGRDMPVGEVEVRSCTDLAREFPMYYETLYLLQKIRS